MNKLATVLVPVVAAVLAAPPAFAQAVKGENIVVMKEPVTTKLPSGKTYVSLGDHQLCTTADPKHPLNGASGNCDGACLIDAAGKSTCMGSCTWVDHDGEMAFFTWDGQESGGWKLAGGSGKWKDAGGQGTWKNTGMQPGNFAHNAWEGTITMKK